MSEKVFGISRGNAKTMLRLFREEQAKNGRGGCYCSQCENDMRNALRIYDELIPICLASESVPLKEFEKLSKLYSLSLKTIEKLVKVAAEKEAKKQAGEKK